MKTVTIASVVCFILILTAHAQVTAATTAVYLPLVVGATALPIPTAIPTATTQPGASPTPTPTLPPPSFSTCANPPANPGSAPQYPVQIIAINKNAETVTLQNVSITTVSLTGWTMCSITGGQTHPISGSLAAGESKVFANTGGLIWNNVSSDPGALYTPDGRLASYWSD
jgi:hypothetical protein